eukprot:586969-Pyramimonas_sp.AAC.1
MAVSLTLERVISYSQYWSHAGESIYGWASRRQCNSAARRLPKAGSGQTYDVAVRKSTGTQIGADWRRSIYTAKP